MNCRKQREMKAGLEAQENEIINDIFYMKKINELREEIDVFFRRK